MRFCDLFISYKIGLKNIKSTIPFTKLPLYRKIFVIILFASAITSGILLIFQQTWASYIPIGLGTLSLIIFFIIDSTKRNLEVMLKEHYTPYSEKRMLMTINVLKNYEIDICHEIGFSSVSLRGHRKEPFSSRLYRRTKPSPSQKRAFILLRCLPQNKKSDFENGSR